MSLPAPTNVTHPSGESHSLLPREETEPPEAPSVEWFAVPTESRTMATIGSARMAPYRVHVWHDSPALAARLIGSGTGALLEGGYVVPNSHGSVPELSLPLKWDCAQVPLLAAKVLPVGKPDLKGRDAEVSGANYSGGQRYSDPLHQGAVAAHLLTAPRAGGTAAAGPGDRRAPGSGAERGLGRVARDSVL